MQLLERYDSAEPRRTPHAHDNRSISGKLERFNSDITRHSTAARSKVQRQTDFCRELQQTQRVVASLLERMTRHEAFVKSADTHEAARRLEV